MSPKGRPEGECRSAGREGNPKGGVAEDQRLGAPHRASRAGAGP